MLQQAPVRHPEDAAGEEGPAAGAGEEADLEDLPGDVVVAEEVPLTTGTVITTSTTTTAPDREVEVEMTTTGEIPTTMEMIVVTEETGEIEVRKVRT